MHQAQRQAGGRSFRRRKGSTAAALQRRDADRSHPSCVVSGADPVCQILAKVKRERDREIQRERERDSRQREKEKEREREKERKGDRVPLTPAYSLSLDWNKLCKVWGRVKYTKKNLNHACGWLQKSCIHFSLFLFLPLVQWLCVGKFDSMHFSSWQDNCNTYITAVRHHSVIGSRRRQQDICLDRGSWSFLLWALWLCTLCFLSFLQRQTKHTAFCKHINTLNQTHKNVSFHFWNDPFGCVLVTSIPKLSKLLFMFWSNKAGLPASFLFSLFLFIIDFLDAHKLRKSASISKWMKPKKPNMQRNKIWVDQVKDDKVP